MAKQTVKTPAADDGIPMFLKRETNAKGVTLSAGPAVTATGAKSTVPAKDKAALKALRKSNAALKADKDKAKPAKAPKVAKSTPTTEAPALNPDGTPIEKVRRSIVPMKFKERYKVHGGTCGDDMALELKAATTTLNADKRETLDVAALWAIAKANEIDVTKYVDLNNGQKRMNVGNKLRGALAAGRDVVIGKRTFKAEDYEPRA